MMNDELYHVGMPRRSGRYPWGSGIKNGKAKAKPRKAKDMTDDELSAGVKRMTLEKTYNQLSGSNNKSKAEKAKSVIDRTSSLVDEAKRINKSTTPARTKLDLSKMTDQQLRDRINRTNLEKQYNDMFAPPATVSKGKAIVTKTIEAAGSVLAIGSSALGIALAIKELKK